MCFRVEQFFFVENIKQLWCFNKHSDMETPEFYWANYTEVCILFSENTE